MIAGNLCSVISNHLIQSLVEPSSYVHNSSKEKITKDVIISLIKKTSNLTQEKSIGKSIVITLTQMFQ